jgi:hypothetical protein
MTLTHTLPRCHRPSLRHTDSLKRSPVKSATPLVPEARVKEMLRDIAFVLRVSCRLSKEIREPQTCTETAHD